MILNKKTNYLQIALNGTIDDARDIIYRIPVDQRIILEAGTPFIKSYGENGIRFIVDLWRQRSFSAGIFPYVVADMKCQDRGSTEVAITKTAGASAITVNGNAPIETINSLILECEKAGLDSMIDMMNVEQPFKILRKLKKLPNVVILHRGVDEETFSKDKPIPYQQINKIRANCDVLIAVAGGDTVREVQRAIFNDANIVVVWKDFYESSLETAELAKEFLKEIK
ncbi:MAG: orotidine 5'-phosphate decarboxylase / HUMPS family protein [bacterium]|nr:orotidine 5'-phosphate decarboxylase / HUMPS family protein [bacterium]